MENTKQREKLGDLRPNGHVALDLPTVLAQQQELLNERYALLDLEYSAPLSEAQTARLCLLEARLNELDDQDPVEQEADRRLAQTSKELDDILAYLRSLPRKKPSEADEMAVAE